MAEPPRADGLGIPLGADNPEIRQDNDLAGPAGIMALICAYSWDCETALRIVGCESRWDAGAVSWAGSYGLFQIHAIHAYRWPDFWESWMNPEVNTAWAYELWQEQGWGIWDCW